MRAVLGWLAALAFATTVICCLLTRLLGFYLDLRRSTLVGAGQLPASTPEVFRVEPSTMSKVVFGVIGINRSHVFSTALDTSPDQATRWWAPFLRKGLSWERVLAGMTAVFFVGFLVSH